ncbi:uncharacterized protein O3Q21_011611 isoform 5-T14 [Podargus strigoides]
MWLPVSYIIRPAPWLSPISAIRLQFYRTLSILYILTPLREIESTYWIVFLLLAVSFVPGLVIGKTVDGRYIKVAREEA